MAAWLSATCGVSRAQAEEPKPLPEPLTLQHALSLANEPHPDLVRARANLDEARAERSAAAARSGVRAYVDGRVQWVDPSKVTPDRGHDDHKIGVVVSKRLYDFGRTEAREQAAQAEVASRELLYADARARRQLDILQAYYNVLIADLRYARDNEAMATAYVEYDRLKDRRDQGQVSDIEVLEAESAYQKVRRRRYASDTQRRATRARLALVLNRPGMLPSTLARPKLPGLDRELPDVAELQKTALENNPRIQALRGRLMAARRRVEAARAEKRPVINGEIEAAEYTRELGSSDRLRAGISFQVPLYSGGTVRSAIARREAQLTRVKARLSAAEMELRQRVLELWQQVYVLRAQQDEAWVTTDYRDLYLDRSRALYQLDIRTDLGDAMVEFSAARLHRAETRYQLAMTLAKLDALLGRPVYPLGAQNKPEESGGK